MLLESVDFIASRLKELKTEADATARVALTTELTKLQKKLNPSQVKFTELSRQCSDHEHKYTARKLIADITERLEKLTKETEEATQIADPLLSGDQSEFLAELVDQSLAGCLQGYAKRVGTTFEDLFSTMSSTDVCTSESFVTFATKLPELTENEEICFTEEQASAIFNRLAGPEGLNAAAFNTLSRCRRSCTEAMPTSAADGSESGSLEVGEAVDIVQEGDRVECVLVRDGKKALVANQGFEPTTAGRADSIAAHVEAVTSRSTQTIEFIEKKRAEIKSEATGPLADAKAKILALGMRVRVNLSKIENVCKRVVNARDEIRQQLKEELRKGQDLRCKALAEKWMAEGNEAVEQAETKVNEVLSTGNFGSSEKLVKECGILELEEQKKVCDATVRVITDCKAHLARILEAHEAYKGPSRTRLLQNRISFIKLSSRVTQFEKKFHAATGMVETAYSKLAKAVASEVIALLRNWVRTSEKDVNAVFDEASKGNAEIDETRFSELVQAAATDKSFPQEKVRLAFAELAAKGFSKIEFASAIQEFYVCAKGIVITDSFDINSSKTIRRLVVDEFFECLDAPEEDSKSQVRRVRGRALRDDVVGWVTVKGSQGTSFLKQAPKPYLSCGADVVLHEGLTPDSAVVRQIESGEVVELLEGPRKETPLSEVTLHGKSKEDAGWITTRIGNTVFASRVDKMYTCRSPIALTDNLDVKVCKVVRRLEVGEALEVVGTVKPEVSGTFTRLRFMAVRDGKEGWVTIKGNKGTTFLEASSTHYVIEKDTPLRQAPAADAPVLRHLSEGESFEALGPPEEQKPVPRLCHRVHCVKDGNSGWVLSPDIAKPLLQPWKRGS